MGKRNSAATKTQLTPVEAVKCYLMNRNSNVSQDDLAMLFDVNSGRVAEAIVVIEHVANDIRGYYRLIRKKK